MEKEHESGRRGEGETEGSKGDRFCAEYPWSLTINTPRAPYFRYEGKGATRRTALLRAGGATSARMRTPPARAARTRTRPSRTDKSESHGLG